MYELPKPTRAPSSAVFDRYGMMTPNTAPRRESGGFMSPSTPLNGQAHHSPHAQRLSLRQHQSPPANGGIPEEYARDDAWHAEAEDALASLTLARVVEQQQEKAHGCGRSSNGSCGSPSSSHRAELAAAGIDALRAHEAYLSSAIRLEECMESAVATSRSRRCADSMAAERAAERESWEQQSPAVRMLRHPHSPLARMCGVRCVALAIVLLWLAWAFATSIRLSRRASAEFAPVGCCVARVWHAARERPLWPLVGLALCEDDFVYEISLDEISRPGASGSPPPSCPAPVHRAFALPATNVISGELAALAEDVEGYDRLPAVALSRRETRHRALGRCAEGSTPEAGVVPRFHAGDRAQCWVPAAAAAPAAPTAAGVDAAAYRCGGQPRAAENPGCAKIFNPLVELLSSHPLLLWPAPPLAAAAVALMLVVFAMQALLRYGDGRAKSVASPIPDGSSPAPGHAQRMAFGDVGSVRRPTQSQHWRSRWLVSPDSQHPHVHLHLDML